MPYKCTTCGKCFRYKVSQRTHKCPAQQTEKLQQASTTDQPTINLINTQNVTNDLSKTQKGFLKDGQSVLNIINNEENKYVLIINTEDQRILTEEFNNEGVHKKQKLEELIMNNEDKEQRNTWKSGISSNPALETSKTSNPKDTNDFFSMVISPLENGLSSPTTQMEHLRVSSPTEKDVLRPYDTFRSTIHNMDIINTSIEQSFVGVNNNTNNLQTINEESLKQLLYSINEK